MTQDTTPTSGAADLPEALINIAREIEALKRDCGMDPESAIAIQNGRYMAISSEIRALAAGQATAAPQGVAYAALPYQWREKVAELADQLEKCGVAWIRTNGGTTYNVGRNDGAKFSASELRKVLADETEHVALRASHGQAPAGAGGPTEQQILEAAFAPAQPAAQPSRFGGPELQAMIIARRVEKDQADSVPAPAPPPECETEAEKRAFAFGWFKALESERMKADNKKKDPL